MNNHHEQPKWKTYLELLIFNIKWLLIPFYLFLVWTLMHLLYMFVWVGHGTIPNEEVLHVIESVDIVMIANLVKMIITGSYNSFVSKEHGYQGENVSSGVLKMKISTSIIGISAIHLLQTFIAIRIEHGSHELTETVKDPITWNVVLMQGAIHMMFIIAAIVHSLINKWHAQAEAIEEETEHKYPHQAHSNNVQGKNHVHHIHANNPHGND